MPAKNDLCSNLDVHAKKNEGDSVIADDWGSRIEQNRRPITFVSELHQVGLTDEDSKMQRVV